MAGKAATGWVIAVYGAAGTAAAIADGLAHSTTRTLPVAVTEALPALILAAAVLRSGIRGARRGARSFAAAMVLVAAGVVATAGTHSQGIALTVGALVAVCGALAVAYLRALIDRASRRRVRVIIVGLALPVLIAACSAASAASLASKPTSECGVDSCAFDGLAIALGVLVVCECVLLLALVPAFALDVRAGVGMLLFGVGTDLMLAVAPYWSQYQGVMGVAFMDGGLALAALAWLAPRPGVARADEEASPSAP